MKGRSAGVERRLLSSHIFDQNTLATCETYTILHHLWILLDADS